MNKIAQDFNQRLSGTAAFELLSDLGRRMYFPRGIVSQTAEAQEKAYRLTATVGMATDGNEPMYLPSLYQGIRSLSPADAFSYVPTAGDKKLRSVWKEEMIRKNPELKGKDISQPLVTSGLTHGITLTAELFIDKGDVVLIPDFFWGNYRLMFEERREAVLKTFPFYTDTYDGMNISALDRAISELPGNKGVLVLNFPNNPSGYSPTVEEARGIVDVLVSHAEKGKTLLVITDDAYFGLFYEEDIYTQSLFAPLADAHERILAVKADAVTKEELAWGFRVGFLTFGGKGLTGDHYEVLEKKTMGAIRSSISNTSRPAQSLVLQAMNSSTYRQEKEEAFAVLKERYLRVKEILQAHRDDANLVPLPFNSGYFMSFICKGDAEKLRVYLLEQYGIGTIAIQSDYLRVAFSSVDIDQLDTLYSLLYQAAGELWT